MQRYDSYKPSDVEWIGQIPSHWEIRRLRFLCEFRNGYTPSKSVKEYWEDGTIPWYRMEDIRENGRKLSEAKQYVTEEAVKGMGLFSAGSFILATTATIGEHALLIADSLANQQFTNLKIRESLIDMFSAEFFFYYLFVIDDFCKSTTKTATFPAVDMNDLKNVSVPLPPLEEQERIAEYLDRRCAEIDGIINKEEQAIALLDELKQTIISEAVTRGLDPTVPLKPSGVDWIGNIPAHWQVSRVKYLGTTLNGLTYKPINVTGADTGVLVLRASNIQNGMLTFEDNVYVDMQIPPELMVQTNDIIICSTNGSLSLVGKLAIVSSDLHATFGSFMLLFRNSPNQHFSHYMLNVVIPKYKALFATTTINQLTKTTFGNMFCPLPPLEEQERIAEYLNRRCAEIDEAKERKQQQIELLREMKQTLISDAVTGRVKVF